MKKTLCIISILLIITMMLVTFIFAENPTEIKPDPNVPESYAQVADINLMIAGLKQNPDLLSNPTFLLVFEKNLQSDPQSLNHDFNTLKKFGQKIGVTFTEGSGISSYDSSSRLMTTDGCVGKKECEANKVRFSPDDIIGVTVNSDGSITIPELTGATLYKGKISKEGNNFVIQDKDVIFNNGEHFFSGPGKIITNGKGVYKLEGKDMKYAFEFGGDPYLSMGIFNERVQGDQFVVDTTRTDSTTGVAQPKITATKPVSLTTHRVDIHGESFETVHTMKLLKGSVTLETEPKQGDRIINYLFDKDSSFEVKEDGAVSKFNVLGKTRLCHGNCYKEVTPATYKKEGISTIEYVRDSDILACTPDNCGPVLKLNAINGGIDLELNDITLVRETESPAEQIEFPFEGIYVHSYTQGSKSAFGEIDTTQSNVVTIKQKGLKVKGKPSFYSSYTVSGDEYTVAYGTTSTGIEEDYKTLPLDTIPIIINKYNPDGEVSVQEATLIEKGDNRLSTSFVYFGDVNVLSYGRSRSVEMGSLPLEMGIK